MNRLMKMVAVSLLLAGCGEHMDGAYGGDYYGPSYDEASDPAAPIEDLEMAPEEAPETEPDEESGAAAGLLTAASWDDNAFYDHYLGYLESADSSHERLPTDRIVIEVKDADGRPLSDAMISVALDEDGTQAIALHTVADGRALFFPSADGQAEAYRVTVTTAEKTGEYLFFAEDSTWSVTMETAQPAGQKTLDVAFVIDATGSMGDEIEYLKREASWLIGEVKAAYPDLTVRMATVAYRDQGDAYVTRTNDFTTDETRFYAQLRDIQADGGGDYPEAMGEAMEAAVRLEWSESSALRLAFVLADAPPQLNRQASTAAAARIARQKGIRIYPIGASGVGDDAEFVMRQMAQHTLGRYLFLTDDSGIGNAHAEPHIPCYHVQRLNDLMLEVIESNLEGAWSAPAAEDIVRSVGFDEEGQCVSPSTAEPEPVVDDAADAADAEGVEAPGEPGVDR